MWPFLHAIPDFLCMCDCCGQGCEEEKCPYCIDGTDFDSYMERNPFVWRKIVAFSLKRDHDYHYHAQ